MEQEKMLHCENCHAIIPMDSAKCPYCGALNVFGGEKQYMERLFDLKEDVEELKDIPVKTYKREFGKNSRMIKRTLIICGIAACLVFGVFFIINKFSYEEIPVAERKEQLLWEKENFPKLDELYAGGDYDGILEYEEKNCKDGYYSIYNWEHADFISIYRWYVFFMDSAMSAQANGYDDDSVHQCIMDAMCMLQKRDYAVYDTGEQKLIEEYQAAVRETLNSQFSMREEDFNALYEECCKEDEYGVYFDYQLADKKVKEYVKHHMKDGKVVGYDEMSYMWHEFADRR